VGKKTSVTIDLMKKEDLDRVIQIERDSFSMPWSRNLFLSEFRSRGVSTLLVSLESEAGTRVVSGYIVFWLVAEEMHILNLAVAPAFRRRGIARSLVLDALGRAREKGARRAFLEVRISNAAAQKLYSSIGFTGVSLRREYYDFPVEDALLMTLEEKALRKAQLDE
jgi:[ribosomal protein S18]-alanine N-acetyltransferase